MRSGACSSLQSYVKQDTNFIGTFTPEDFNKCSQDLLNSLKHELRSFTNRIRPEKVESIVFAGGSSQMPLFKGKLRRVFPHAVLKETITVEEAVAKGAVIVARHIPLTCGDYGKADLSKGAAALDKTEETADTAAVIGAQLIPPTSNNCKMEKLTLEVAKLGHTAEASATRAVIDNQDIAPTA